MILKEKFSYDKNEISRKKHDYLVKPKRGEGMEKQRESGGGSITSILVSFLFLFYASSVVEGHLADVD